MNIKRVGIVTHPDPKVSAGYLEQLVEMLESRGIATEIETAVKKGSKGPDLIFVLGGDGTMLKASRLYPGRVLLGVNLGKVGFMSGMRPDEIESGVLEVLNGDLNIQEYRMLEVMVGGDTQPRLAVNDAVIVKECQHRIISVELAAAGEELGTYQSDGFVAATPLGSTAYSLSAGGPIVSGSVDCYVLTAVAPHTLLSRPLVMGADEVAEFRIVEDRALLSLDGIEPQVLVPGDTVQVKLSEERVKIGRTHRWSWWKAVRRTFL